jgi:hypothetical protein
MRRSKSVRKRAGLAHSSAHVLRAWLEKRKGLHQRIGETPARSVPRGGFHLHASAHADGSACRAYRTSTALIFRSSPWASRRIR